MTAVQIRIPRILSAHYAFTMRWSGARVNSGVGGLKARVLLLGVVCVFLAMSGPAGAVSTSQSYLYQEKNGEDVKEFRWNRSSTAQEELVTVYEKDATLVNHCDSTGQTLAWHFQQGKQTDIRASREGNLLKLTGILDGQRVERIETLDDRPWYQPLSFSLQGFLNSAEDRQSFWMVRSDNLELVTIHAEKQGVEEVSVSGRKVQATKVEIRKEGLFASLWHGDYWFRAGDNLFVRYQGVHGPPGTPETVVQLSGDLTIH